MTWKGWDRVMLDVPDQDDPSLTRQVRAIAPLIISASRATDIPALYGDWFMHRLSAGYVKWKSPFGGQPVYVSFERARVFAFWSKNPAPFIPSLDTLDRLGYGWFFLFTLNDYEPEGLEPGIPRLQERVETFMNLSRRAGAGRVTWRFDPLLLSDTISVDVLLDRIRNIGEMIHPFTRRLVISFIDIERYGKVQRNLAASGHKGIREFDDNEITELASGLARLNERWGLSITACGEKRGLSAFGIGRGQCIGYDFIASEFHHDPVLMNFLSVPIHGNRKDPVSGASRSRYLKDPGQRNSCGCMVSKDIGEYSTCLHACAYCYANASRAAVERNRERYRARADKGVFFDSITG